MLANAAHIPAAPTDEHLTALEMLAEGRITRAYFEEMTGARSRSRHLLEAAIEARQQNGGGDRTARMTDRHRRPAARPEPVSPPTLRLVGTW